jgi:hypothetical protein
MSCVANGPKRGILETFAAVRYPIISGFLSDIAPRYAHRDAFLEAENYDALTLESYQDAYAHVSRVISRCPAPAALLNASAVPFHTRNDIR